MRGCLLFGNKATEVSGQAGLLGSVATGRGPEKRLGVKGWLCAFQGHKLLPFWLEFSSLIADHGSEKPAFIVLDACILLRAAPATLLPLASLVAKDAGSPQKPPEVRARARTPTS